MLAYIGFGVITVVNGNGALSFSSLIDLLFFFLTRMELFILIILGEDTLYTNI